jgi:cytochrome c-type biogenesis protein CcmH/NrfG
VYLRSLGDGQGPQSSDMLKAAITEYEKIAQLKPNDLETHLLLGQLYGLNHDSAKAQAQFKEAQRIDSGSEEVVLSMARLYTEQGDLNFGGEGDCGCAGRTIAPRSGWTLRWRESMTS